MSNRINSAFLALPVTHATGRSNRLVGWKAIGQFLGCTDRTARRWERSRGLPVHRIKGGGRGSVWGAPEELTVWLQSMPEETQAGLRAELQAETAPGSLERFAETRGAGVAQPVAHAEPPHSGAGSADTRRHWVFVAIALIFVVLSAALFVRWSH